MTGNQPQPPRVARWTRYGHDRLYVTAADGTRLGWYDVKTGRVTVDQPDRENELRAALAAHPLVDRAVPGNAAPKDKVATGVEDDPAAVSTITPAPPSPSTPTSAVHEERWRDLAANRPGQAARAQADEHLHAMRDRSRVGTFLARALDLKTDERAWRTGAQGEESVGARLERLTDRGWHVLHAVPVGHCGADIDHLLIGPGGVYTINTKNHPGKRIWVSPTQIRVDGQPVPYLRNSRFEADRARRTLTQHLGWEPPLRPVLILLTGTLIPDVTVKDGGPDDVLILDRMNVPGAFKRAPARITADQAAAIYAIARRSTTWT